MLAKLAKGLHTDDLESLFSSIHGQHSKKKVSRTIHKTFLCSFKSCRGLGMIRADLSFQKFKNIVL